MATPAYVNGLELLGNYREVSEACTAVMFRPIMDSAYEIGGICVEAAVGMSIFALLIVLWILDTIRMKSTRAYLCLIAAVFSAVYSAVLSRTLVRQGRSSVYYVIPLWFFPYTVAALIALAVVERSLLIVRNRNMRRRIVIAIRIVVCAYTVAGIIYGIYASWDTYPRMSLFYGYGGIPFITFVGFLNVLFLYYGYRYILPNELKLGITNSKLLTMFNYTAFFAVFAQVFFVLLILDLLLLRDDPYVGAHANLCLSLTCLAEYFMDRGVHLKTYMNFDTTKRLEFMEKKDVPSGRNSPANTAGNSPAATLFDPLSPLSLA